MEEKIMAILNDICGAEEGELEPDLNLFDTGLLDSFGVVQLIVEMEEAFDLALNIESISREEIATPARIVKLVKQTI